MVKVTACGGNRRDKLERLCVFEDLFFLNSQHHFHINVIVQLLKKAVMQSDMSKKQLVLSSDFGLLKKQWAFSVHTQYLKVEFLLADMRSADDEARV